MIIDKFEFDFCEKSPTKKHSESWFCNFACEHCGQDEDNGTGEPGPSDKIDYSRDSHDSMMATLDAKFDEFENIRTYMEERINDLVTANALIEELRADNEVLKYQVESFRQQLIANAAEDAKDVTPDAILKQRVRVARIREYIDSQERFVFTEEVIAVFPEYKEKHVRRAIATIGMG